MVSDSEELIRVPYSFKHKEKRAVLAFVEGKELQEFALESGAEIALGSDVIKKILKGQFKIDDYDFCVAHTNMAKDIAPLRGILRSKFPTKLNGGLGDDLADIIQSFSAGVKIFIKGDHVYPHWGLVQPIIGTLDMPDKHIEENARAVVTAVCKHRNPAIGPFINRALLMTIPGTVHVAINVNDWLPVPTELQKKQVEKKKKKKRKLVEEDKEELIDPRTIDPMIELM